MGSNIKKVIIRAFSNKQLTNETGSFVLPLNPETYAQTFKVEFDAEPAQGAQRSEGRFKSSAPEELKLDFVLDGTGTAYGYVHEKKTVPEQLQELKQTVYDLSGDIHQPRFLKIVWKDFVFDCVLTEMTVNFVLFDAEGIPLRAKVACSFLNYKETERRVREENKNSPDLTHARTVKDQDTLHLLSHQIYGVPDYYLEVARANGLTNFRHLTSGDTLLFYPLDKIQP